MSGERLRVAVQAERKLDMMDNELDHWRVRGMAGEKEWEISSLSHGFL